MPDVVLVILILGLFTGAGWLLHRARERVMEWLHSKGLGGLPMIGIGAAWFLLLDHGSTTRWLGIVLVAAGLYSLTRRRSAKETSGSFYEVLESMRRRAEREGTPPADPPPLNFGPNHALVEAFLKRMDNLTHAQWKTVIDRAENGTTWQRWTGYWTFIAHPRATRALERAGRERERGDVLVALSERFPDNIHKDAAASSAVDALVLRDRISEKDFATLYSPFEPFIPVRSLNWRGVGAAL